MITQRARRHNDPERRGDATRGITAARPAPALARLLAPKDVFFSTVSIGQHAGQHGPREPDQDQG